MLDSAPLLPAETVTSPFLLRMWLAAAAITDDMPAAWKLMLATRAVVGGQVEPWSPACAGVGVTRGVGDARIRHDRRLARDAGHAGAVVTAGRRRTGDQLPCPYTSGVSALLL